MVFRELISIIIGINLNADWLSWLFHFCWARIQSWPWCGHNIIPNRKIIQKEPFWTILSPWSLRSDRGSWWLRRIYRGIMISLWVVSLTSWHKCSCLFISWYVQMMELWYSRNLEPWYHRNFGTTSFCVQPWILSVLGYVIILMMI